MKLLILLVAIGLIFGGVLYFKYNNQRTESITQQTTQNISENVNPKHPLSIEYMRAQTYPGSDIIIEQTLSSGSNYNKYIASYKSDGLKIQALLTIPKSAKPESGWPIIIFNHGYIPPTEYKTTERYLAYTDAFSRNGYIVLKPDYRGHGSSEGNPVGAYYSPAYTIDVLNAVASIKKYKDADPNRIGMWGHSMGGSITLRSMITTKDIKAGVIWAGVVASYQDMATNWNPKSPFRPSAEEQAIKRPSRQQLIDTYGSFESNPDFWDSITPIKHVADISGPIQIHHGTADEDVPVLFSLRLDEALKAANKVSEYYVYEGDNHNLSENLNVALARSVKFFDDNVKN